MLTLFISFTHSSDVTWPHPQTPQTPRLPALANPVPLCCGDHLVWGGGCWAVAKEPRGAPCWTRPQSPDRTSRGQQAGVSPEQPLPWPLVPITVLSRARPDRLFQTPFSTASGSSPETPSPPPPPCTPLSAPPGHWPGRPVRLGGWECDEWPEAEGCECAQGPQELGRWPSW